MVVLPRPLSVQVAHLCVTWWIHLRRVLYFACRLGIDTRPRDDARVYPLCDLLGDERAALVGSAFRSLGTGQPVGLSLATPKR
jgi:hypothetical protein